MKTSRTLFTLFSLAILIAALSGCATKGWYGPSPDGTYDNRGPRLDTKGSPDVENIIDNQSKETLFVDIEGHSFSVSETLVQVNPGTKLTRKGRSYRRLKVTIRWMGQGYRNVLGYSEEEMQVLMPGLYSGKPIVITDDMLRGEAPMEGLIICQGDPTLYQDDRGHRFAMQNGDKVEVNISSGPITIKVRSLHDPKRFGSRTLPTSCIDLRTDQYEVIGPDGKKKRYDFTIIIDESWRWRW
jgi:hypothetical protein